MIDVTEEVATIEEMVVTETPQPPNTWSSPCFYDTCI